MNEINPYTPEPIKNKAEQPDLSPIPFRSSNNHIWIGAFLLVIGSLFLLRRLGIDFPDFLFSWQMFIIGLGVYIGVRKNFEGPGWLILVLVGSLLLINEYFVYGELRRFIFPITLIGAGLFFIFRPRAPKFEQKVMNPVTGEYETTIINSANASIDDFVESTSVFGGTKKKVFSKNFRGGDIVNIFGGSEIDLTHADFTGSSIVEVTTIFGGATILVPANWNVISNAVAILGEVKDKRGVFNNPENNKTLIIKGTVIFGGVDIKSF